MSAAIEELLNSNVWDARYDLPLVGVHRNPHIYCADTIRLLETLGDEERKFAAEQRSAYRDFLSACEVQKGLITTYPGEESASHDDVLGAAFLNCHDQEEEFSFAERVVTYLTKKDGSYILGKPDSERNNIYRYPFFAPTMKSLAGFRVGLVSQLLYCVALLFHLWTTKPHQMSGHNLFWVTFPTMLEHPFSRAAILYWDEKQIAKGYTPRTMFETHYLTECPWFAKWAPESWVK